ncbi:MAG: hypothetical protein JW937_06750, partial [Candidatus Omnitrophica bacterium]|nr:hypothetical protein [Candidatus Omnitrophota bacterium]
FLGLLVLAMVLPVLIIATSVYAVVAYAMSNGFEISQAELAKIMPSAMLGLWVVFGVIALVTMWVVKQGLSISHQYVGPLDRLERELMKTTQPDLSYRLHCRPGDVISPIIDPINRLLDSAEKQARRTPRQNPPSN